LGKGWKWKATKERFEIKAGNLVKKKQEQPASAAVRATMRLGEDQMRFLDGNVCLDTRLNRKKMAEGDGSRKTESKSYDTCYDAYRRLSKPDTLALGSPAGKITSM
jgi:hypothetical protein